MSEGGGTVCAEVERPGNLMLAALRVMPGYGAEHTAANHSAAAGAWTPHADASEWVGATLAKQGTADETC